MTTIISKNKSSQSFSASKHKTFTLDDSISMYIRGIHSGFTPHGFYDILTTCPRADWILYLGMDMGMFDGHSY